MMKFTIRWLDGNLAHGTAIDWRIGGYYLWVKLENGEERWYPNSQIRWFSFGENSTIV